MGSAIHPGEAIETYHYQLYVVQQPERMTNISKNKKNSLYFAEELCQPKKHKIFNKKQHIHVCVCLCVCVCVRVCVWVCMCLMVLYVGVCVSMCMCERVCVCMSVHMFECMCLCLCVCKYVSVRVCVLYVLFFNNQEKFWLLYQSKSLVSCSKFKLTYISLEKRWELSSMEWVTVRQKRVENVRSSKTRFFFASNQIHLVYYH